MKDNREENSSGSAFYFEKRRWKCVFFFFIARSNENLWIPVYLKFNQEDISILLLWCRSIFHAFLQRTEIIKAITSQNGMESLLWQLEVSFYSKFLVIFASYPSVSTSFIYGYCAVSETQVTNLWTIPDEMWSSKFYIYQMCFKLAVVVYNSVHDEMQTRARWQVRKCVSYPVKKHFIFRLFQSILYCKSVLEPFPFLRSKTKKSLYSWIVSILSPFTRFDADDARGIEALAAVIATAI